MKSVLALVFVMALTLVAHGQTCVDGVCSVDGRPTRAPLLPAVAPVLRSVIEQQPVRRAAAIPVHYARHHVLQPTMRYSGKVISRVFRIRSNFRCR